MKSVIKVFSVLLLLTLCSFIAEEVLVYKKVKLLKKVSMELPNTFTKMDTSKAHFEDLKKHFPAYRAPIAAYRGPNNQVAFGFNVMRTPWDGDLALLKDFYKSNVYRTFNKVDFSVDTVMMINKREYAILAFDSKIKDMTGGPSMKKYHYMAYTIYM